MQEPQKHVNEACHEESTVFLITTEKLKPFLQLLLGPRTAVKMRKPRIAGWRRVLRASIDRTPPVEHSKPCLVFQVCYGANTSHCAGSREQGWLAIPGLPVLRKTLGSCSSSE